MQNDNQNQSYLTPPPMPMGAAGGVPPVNGGMVGGGPAGMGGVNVPMMAPGGMSANPGAVNSNGAASLPPIPKEHGGLIKTIVIIALSLIAATFIGLFIWMFVQYDAAHTDVQGQIKEAVAEAELKQKTEMEEEFTEREKEPMQIFSGPEEYGTLSFYYPKTWSVYEASDASDRKDYEAYFNPGKVPPLGRESRVALRLTIANSDVNKVKESYTKMVDKGELKFETRTVNGDVTADFYQGALDKSIVGRVVIFAVRDKTAIIQTDAETFAEDFEKLITTITFVK